MIRALKGYLGHNHQDNDFYDDNDNEMMIRTLRVTWVIITKIMIFMMIMIMR